MQRPKLDMEQLKKLVTSYNQGFQIQIRTEEYKRLTPDFEDEDDEYDAPVIYVPGPCCPDSAILDRGMLLFTIVTITQLSMTIPKNYC